MYNRCTSLHHHRPRYWQYTQQLCTHAGWTWSRKRNIGTMIGDVSILWRDVTVDWIADSAVSRGDARDVTVSSSSATEWETDRQTDRRRHWTESNRRLMSHCRDGRQTDNNQPNWSIEHAQHQHCVYTVMSTVYCLLQLLALADYFEFHALNCPCQRFLRRLISIKHSKISSLATICMLTFCRYFNVLC